MTNEEKALIIALVLGDGHISQEGRLHINHCEKQKEYLEYKANILHKIIGGKPIKIHKTKNKIKDTIYYGYGIKKCCKKKLESMRQLLYPEGKKVITREILEYLTPQGIAIWYMDDGNLYAEKKNDKICAYKLGIATYLSKEENQIIIDYFKEKWDLEFKSHKDGNQYRLRMGTKEARKFLNLVRPYISDIECMRYKVIDI